MVDWSEVTLAFDRIASLDEADFERELEALSAKSPETADLIKKQVSRERASRQFMMTHALETNSEKNSLVQGDRLGPWEIEGLVGSGGMGNVYRAIRRDGAYDQTVAIKQIHGGDQAQLARFEAERNRLAQLEHPNIARIIDGGTDDDAGPYMALELVDGEPIDVWADKVSASREERVQLLCQLTDALAHSHARLVLHRDIKAANVLVNSGGQIRLIDFGISAIILDDQTAERLAPLTLAIAAPEQLTGGSVNAATDIFMVGMLAHQLIAGHLPKRNADGSVTVDHGRIEDRDLAAILDKATAVLQSDRYASVDALQDDLEKFLGGLPVAARLQELGGGARYRFGKLVKRYRLAGAAIVVAAMALVGGTVASVISAHRADAALVTAEERLQEAQYFTEEAQRNMDSTGALNDFLNIVATGPGGIGEERLSQSMIEYGDSLLNELADNPKGSSASLYGVVRFLGTKGYNTEAVRIAEATLKNPEIPEVVRLGLMETQGRNLFMIDRKKDSAAILADLLDRMETRPFLVRSPGYAAILKNYVLYSGDHERLEEATELMIALAEDQQRDAGSRAFYYNEAALLVGKTGNLQLHVDLLIEAHHLTQLAEANNTMSGATRTLNLVYAILYGTQDVARAREFMPDEQSLFGEIRGNIRHRSLYLWLTGLAQQLDGDVIGAATTYERAAQSVAKELPENDGQRIIVIMHAAEAQAMAGDPTAGRALFNEVAKNVDTSEPIAKSMTRMALIDGLIAAHEGDYRRAKSLLDAAQRNEEVILGSPEHRFLVKKLDGLLKQAVSADRAA